MSADDSPTPLPKGANLARAIALFHQGRFDRMEVEARAELARDPDSHEALTWLGLALLKLDKEEEALQVLADAIRLRPDYADAHYVRARVLWRQTERKRIMTALFSMIFESDKKEHAALQEQTEAALAEAIRLDPNSTEYLDFLADMRREQGRYEEGLAAADRGLALDPQHVGCLHNRAMLLDKLGRLAEARQAFSAALVRAPESPGLHYEFGKLLLNLDAPGLALEHLREALRLHPNLEGEVRPLIAEAMKRHSPLYDWLGKHITSPWVLGGFVGLLLAVAYFSRDLQWPPLEILQQHLVPGMGFILLFLSFLSAIDPLHNLSLCRTPFGWLMLSPTERRQAYAVATCVVVALIGAVWFAFSGKYTPAYLCLFALFWIDPVAQCFTLYPRSLQRIATVCTILSILFIAGHLIWRWFSPEEVWKAWFPYGMALAGVGFFLLFIPFILSRSASEFSFWRPRSRRWAVLVFWSLLTLSWFLLVGGCFAAYLAEDGSMFHAIRKLAMVSGVALGCILYFEKTLIDWLTVKFGGKPAT
jgi:tetratricopeptide (TPR) repeat protein